MKNMPSLVLMTFIIFSTGCNIFDSKDDNEKSLSAEVYFPLQVGAEWKYNMRKIYPEIEDYTIYNTLFTKISEYDGNHYRIDLKVNENGEWKLGGFFSYGDDVVYKTGIYTHNIPFLYFNKDIGYSWSYTDSIVFTDSSKITNTEITYLGNESINVPAGKFDNCMKFESTTIVSIIQGDNTRIDEYTIFSYYASGVGLVKETGIPKHGDYYDVNELFEYTIP